MNGNVEYITLHTNEEVAAILESLQQYRTEVLSPADSIVHELESKQPDYLDDDADSILRTAILDCVPESDRERVERYIEALEEISYSRGGNNGYSSAVDSYSW